MDNNNTPYQHTTSFNSLKERAYKGDYTHDDYIKPGDDLSSIHIGENNGVKRMLSTRHLQMIAIGGTIGTGLFLASGGTIANAGPVGALLAYLLVSIMVYFVTTSLGEMATLLPLSGSFTTFSGRFVDSALSFTIGWSYWLQWSISLASELCAIGMILKFWVNVPSWIPALITLIILTCINLFSVKNFAEIEFWLAIIKIVAVIVFILIGLLLFVGLIKSEHNDYHKSDGGLWFTYWSIEGAPFKNGISGFFNVFILAFFAFGGTELIGVTAGEAKDPRKTVPKAINQTFYRILIFYIGSILVLGLCIPNNDPTLLNNGDVDDVTSAPYTIIFQKAGLKSAAHVINAVILIAVVSASNSALYASSRTLMNLAVENKAPKFFTIMLPNGIPIYALLATSLVGCLAFLGTLLGDGQIYILLLNLTAMSGVLTWFCISLVHYRFRKAYVAQGRKIEDLPYVAPFHPYGDYISMTFAVIILFGEAYAIVTDFNAHHYMLQLVAAFVGLFIFVGMYLLYRFIYKVKLVPLQECNLDYTEDDCEGILLS